MLLTLRDGNVEETTPGLYGRQRKVNPKPNFLPDEVQRYYVIVGSQKRVLQ